MRSATAAHARVMQAGDSFAYRTYLVTRLLLGEYIISKDGHHIAITRSPDEARTAIDGLLPAYGTTDEPARLSVQG